MSDFLQFSQFVTYTAISKDGTWMRCNDHFIPAGTTYQGIIDSLASELPDHTFAEIAWEMPDNIVWMDDLVDCNFDSRYNHRYVRDKEKMASFKVLLFSAS